jgi:hypothetical protein
VFVFRRVRNAWIEWEPGLQPAPTDFRNRRAVTAPNVIRRNNRRAYQRVYGNERLMGEHLARGRLAFYVEVVELIAAERPSVVVINVPDGAVDDWDGHENFRSESELASFLGRWGDVEITPMQSDPLSLLACGRPRRGADSGN